MRSNAPPLDDTTMISIAFTLLLAFAPQAGPLTLTVPDGTHEPELAVDDDGSVALAVASSAQVCVMLSSDRGASFPTRSTIDAGCVLAVGQRSGPKVAFAGKRLCVAVIGGERGKGKDGDLLVFSRERNAHEWSAGTRVNSVAGSAREGLHALASGPKGELFAAWIDLRGAEPAVYGALSSDGGRTWGENRRISSGTKLCPCCSPSAAIDRDGTVYVTWRAEQDGARDLVLASSKDAFATRASEGAGATKLGSATWKIEMCPMDGGSVRAAGDDVLAVWRSDATVFAASPRALERVVELGNGMQPVVAIGLEAHAVWSERRGGKLFARELGRELALSPEPRELAPSATCAVVASSPTRGKGPVVVAWETSYTNGKVQVLRLEP